ncbi:MAG: VanZ family protein [Lachnospiraceae bacterium]|nr:VanZ family protein [Lachnospiraceae bacterium]
MIFTQYKKQIRVLCWILFALYIAVMVYFLFFADMLGRTTDTAQLYNPNLILFREIRRFWIYRSRFGCFYTFLNLAGNILVFMPFGFLLPIMSRKLRGFFRIILLGLALSLAVEFVQLATNTGCFDVDDLLLNTVGAALGYLIYALVQRRRKKNAEYRDAQA